MPRKKRVTRRQREAALRNLRKAWAARRKKAKTRKTTRSLV